MLHGKSILITGGTGSFGKAFIEAILKEYPDIKKVIVFSRDELKQFEMMTSPAFQPYCENGTNKLRFFIGDVRDLNRLRRACEGVDVIIHAAALKQVPAAEYNPLECIKTNVYGAQNIIDAAMDCGVKKVVALSTDKAAAPINLYGATKLCSDKLFIAASNMIGNRELSFSVVRYGNVMGSRGSVIPFFIKQRESGFLPITDENMTRFSISLEDAVRMVLYALENANGGEIFVPKIPSYKITDIAKAIAPDCEQKLTGIRPGEKIHEEMITESDSQNTVDCGKYYAILSPEGMKKFEMYAEKFDAKKVPQGFKYNSGTNDDWLTPEDLRVLIKKHVNPNFEV
ncbi:MAG: UDP-N-acetylglucosamine 4,6-dehydratase (inverting) [Bacteriovoracaceae bacterium]|nr:UDP-N-acetylglucosamine 4,6-dehydratase (inverting) [Bacteriovoracaceae bacterium]